MPGPLAIVTLGEITCDPDLPRWLRDELASELEMEVEIAPPLPIDPAWREADTGRLSSNRIIDDLAAAPTPVAWTLALVEADLYAPGRAFVFGEATLGGPLALLALQRLRPADGQTFRLRALKEALHEIGHLAGLEHCADDRCVMHASSNIRDVDRKLAALCEPCRDRVARAGPGRAGTP